MGIERGGEWGSLEKQENGGKRDDCAAGGEISRSRSKLLILEANLASSVPEIEGQIRCIYTAYSNIYTALLPLKCGYTGSRSL